MIRFGIQIVRCKMNWKVSETKSLAKAQESDDHVMKKIPEHPKTTTDFLGEPQAANRPTSGDRV